MALPPQAPSSTWTPPLSAGGVRRVARHLRDLRVVSEDRPAAGGAALHPCSRHHRLPCPGRRAIKSKSAPPQRCTVSVLLLPGCPDPRRLHVQVLSGHEGPVAGLAFSPTSSLLASASWDHTLRTWDVFAGKGQQLLCPKPDRFMCA
jgi:WD40 repeat protein